MSGDDVNADDVRHDFGRRPMDPDERASLITSLTRRIKRLNSTSERFSSAVANMTPAQDARLSQTSDWDKSQAYASSHSPLSASIPGGLNRVLAFDCPFCRWRSTDDVMPHHIEGAPSDVRRLPAGDQGEARLLARHSERRSVHGQERACGGVPERAHCGAGRPGPGLCSVSVVASSGRQGSRSIHLARAKLAGGTLPASSCPPHRAQQQRSSC